MALKKVAVRKRVTVEKKSSNHHAKINTIWFCRHCNEETKHEVRPEEKSGWIGDPVRAFERERFCVRCSQPLMTYEVDENVFSDMTGYGLRKKADKMMREIIKLSDERKSIDAQIMRMLKALSEN